MISSSKSMIYIEKQKKLKCRSTSACWTKCEQFIVINKGITRCKFSNIETAAAAANSYG